MRTASRPCTRRSPKDLRHVFSNYSNMVRTDSRRHQKAKHQPQLLLSGGPLGCGIEPLRNAVTTTRAIPRYFLLLMDRSSSREPFSINFSFSSPSWCSSQSSTFPATWSFLLPYRYRYSVYMAFSGSHNRYSSGLPPT